MRLSTDRERDDERAFTVLHAAFDGGVTFFDTADAYCLDDSDVGHNEKLIARSAPGAAIDPASLSRRKAAGLERAASGCPPGRARHLRAACERDAEEFF
jgi:aryl-alcohol dehydrogenase-like predicted oxidoreductase